MASATLSVQLGPSIDDLVVLFTAGDQTVIAYCCSNSSPAAGLIDQALLGYRDDHVVLAEGNAGLTGFRKPKPIICHRR
jgi:hypothetical protein